MRFSAAIRRLMPGSRLSRLRSKRGQENPRQTGRRWRNFAILASLAPALGVAVLARRRCNTRRLAPMSLGGKSHRMRFSGIAATARSVFATSATRSFDSLHAVTPACRFRRRFGRWLVSLRKLRDSARAGRIGVLRETANVGRLCQPKNTLMDHAWFIQPDPIPSCRLRRRRDT